MFRDEVVIFFKLCRGYCISFGESTLSGPGSPPGNGEQGKEAAFLLFPWCYLTQIPESQHQVTPFLTQSKCRISDPQNPRSLISREYWPSVDLWVLRRCLRVLPSAIHSSWRKAHHFNQISQGPWPLGRSRADNECWNVVCNNQRETTLFRSMTLMSRDPKVPF